MPVQERAAQVTLKGNPVTLLGNELSIGQQAPECTLTANDLSEVKLSSFKGKKCILVALPSLDTPVCDLEGKRFNEEAAKLENTAVLLISTDLPFAQSRWCGATGSDKIQTLSDHRDANFGENFGILIKGLRLLARAIFILDQDGKLQYTQLVNEIAEEPDYAAVLAAAQKI